MNKKVYYDVENTLDVPFITGIQRVSREFSKIVLNENFKPSNFQFIAVVYDQPKAKWRKLSAHETKCLTAPKPRSLKFLSRVTNKIRRTIPKPKRLTIQQFEKGSIFLDIDSSWHSPLKRSVLLPALKAQGVKLAKLHYDIIPLLFPSNTHPNTTRVFADHFISHLENTDLFLCISENTRDDVIQYCKERDRKPPILETIRLGSNIFSDNTQASSSALANQLPEFGKFILTVGTLEPRKNHRLLIQAYDQISDECDLNLVIVGKTGWLADDILAKIRQHTDFGTRIHHLDSVTDQQLDHLYRNAWLNVVPSKYEGFGLPVVESLARGCPTICSTAGSLREVGGDAVGFFSPTSEDELARLIQNLYFDSGSHKNLQKAAVQFIPNRWLQTVEDINLHLNKLR